MNRSLDTLLEDVRKSPLRDMAAHWLTLLRRSRSIPRLRDIDPLRFATAMRDAWLIDAEPDGEFRFRLSGETLVDWYGINPKGRTLRDLCTPELFRVLTANSRRMIDGPAILYHRVLSVMPGQEQPASFERIGLPLSDDDGRVRHLLGATVFDQRYYNGKGALSTAVDYEYVYELFANDGLITARPSSR